MLRYSKFVCSVYVGKYVFCIHTNKRKQIHILHLIECCSSHKIICTYLTVGMSLIFTLVSFVLLTIWVHKNTNAIFSSAFFRCRSHNPTISVCLFPHDCWRFATDIRGYSFTRSAPSSWNATKYHTIVCLFNSS